MRAILLSALSIVSLWAAAAQADFFVYERTRRVTCFTEICDEDWIWDDVVACPANRDNCNCWGKGPAGTVTVPENDGEMAEMPPAYFQMSGFCGKSSLNFYYQHDGRTWKYFDAGSTGNGQPLGTCQIVHQVGQCDIDFLATATVAKKLHCTGLC